MNYTIKGAALIIYLVPQKWTLTSHHLLNFSGLKNYSQSTWMHVTPFPQHFLVGTPN